MCTGSSGGLLDVRGVFLFYMNMNRLAEAEPDANADTVEYWAAELIHIECEMSRIMLTCNELKTVSPRLPASGTTSSSAPARCGHWLTWCQGLIARSSSTVSSRSHPPRPSRTFRVVGYPGFAACGDFHVEVSRRGAGRPRGNRWRLDLVDASIFGNPRTPWRGRLLSDWVMLTSHQTFCAADRSNKSTRYILCL